MSHKKIIYPERYGLSDIKCLNFIEESINKNRNMKQILEMYDNPDITKEQYFNVFKEAVFLNVIYSKTVKDVLDFLISKYGVISILEIYFNNYYKCSMANLLAFHDKFDEYMTFEQYNNIIEQTLKLAVESGRYDLVKSIMKKVESYNIYPEYIENEYIYICINNKDINSLKYLIKLPMHSKNYENVLIACIENNWIELINKLKHYPDEKINYENIMNTIIKYNRIDFLDKLYNKLREYINNNIELIVELCYQYKRFDLLNKINIY